MNERRTHGGTCARSEESSLTEIAVGKAEGLAYGAALRYLASLEASDSGEKQAGDYLVAYSIEDAEGLYMMRNGRLQWQEPNDENCHLEISVRSAADGRFIPCLNVGATLTSKEGNLIGAYEMPFLWHPCVYHYGRNCIVPRDGEYRLQVHIEVPGFPRHDRNNGDRFTTPTDVQFDVKIKTGREMVR
jgi:hypothetical protein